MEALTETQRKEVRNRYKNLVFPDPVLEPIWYGRRPETKIEGKFAIVDQGENETVFGICSDQYQVVHYEDIISLTEKVFKEVQSKQGKIEIMPCIIDQGRKMRISATMLEAKYEIKKGDIINPTVTVRTSYDLGWRFSSVFGAFRLICTNGAKAGITFDRFAKKHMQSLEPTMMVDSILKGMELYNAQVAQWKQWTKTKVPELIYTELWTALPFSEGEKEKIEKTVEMGSKNTLEDKKWRDQINLWDLHSVMTQYVTHEVKSEVRKNDLETDIARVFDHTFSRLTH